MYSQTTTQMEEQEVSVDVLEEDKKCCSNLLKQIQNINSKNEFCNKVCKVRFFMLN